MIGVPSSCLDIRVHVGISSCIHCLRRPGHFNRLKRSILLHSFCLLLCFLRRSLVVTDNAQQRAYIAVVLGQQCARFGLCMSLGGLLLRDAGRQLTVLALELSADRLQSVQALAEPPVLVMERFACDWFLHFCSARP